MMRRVPPQPLIDVVVPARDHAGSLGTLPRDLPHRVIRSVVVVDRASTDRTPEIARDAGALVLREPSGGYGAACLRAQAHFSALPRVPDVIEFVLGIEPGRRGLGAKLVTGLIDTVYRHRWSGVGPVRAMRFPALIALGMSDRADGWDVEMLVRAIKLGLSCAQIPLPRVDQRAPPGRGCALLHILRHAT